MNESNLLFLVFSEFFFFFVLYYTDISRVSRKLFQKQSNEVAVLVNHIVCLLVADVILGIFIRKGG